jgi:hypothetical protein
MFRRKLIAIVAGLSVSLVVDSTVSFAMGPIAGGASSPNLAVPVSFWGRPFPYGYTGWGRCMRYVPVETAYGTSWQLVSVCGYRHDRALRVRS